MVVAQKYKKPVVLEEFGFPRDGFRFSKSTSTEVRDEYYQYVFDLIRQDRENGGLLPDVTFGHGVVLLNRIPTISIGKREMITPEIRLRKSRD